MDETLSCHATEARSIHVRDGVIESVKDYDEIAADCELIETNESSVVMALVDTHVHVNAPGRTDWEGFQTATRAAAAGGTTTIVDMPLNSIPATTTLGAFKTKLDEARDKCFVDVGFGEAWCREILLSSRRCSKQAWSVSSVSGSVGCRRV